MAMDAKTAFFFLLLWFHCTYFTSFAHESSSKPFYLQTLPADFFNAFSAIAPSPNSPPPPPPPAGFPPPPPPPEQPSPPPPPPPTEFAPPPPELPSSPPPPSDEGGSSGLSGGQKAGIVIGTLAGTGVLVLGGMIYKKRRSNIRRARFGTAARSHGL